MKSALIIKVKDGATTISRVPFEKGTLEYYYKEIGCEIIDIAHAYGLSIDADIIIDDNGLFGDNPEINAVASIAYGYLEHGQPIVGNAIICKPHQTTDGIDETGFEDDEADKIMNEIMQKMMFLDRG